MSDLNKLPNHWDPKKRECRVIIETPKGRRSKFDYDPKTMLFKLGGLLAEGLSFPYDFGFIPSTLAADGDPLDVMVFIDEPTHVGCLIDVRLIGVIEAEQTGHGKQKKERNDRLIAVAIHSYTHEDVTSLDQVSKSTLDQVDEFFVTYNHSRGKKFQILGRHGPKRAEKLVDEGIRTFRKKKRAD